MTIAVALDAFDSLGDRFDEVVRRSERQALALELKFAVTDVNGWQTAYGYDGGRSRPQFERSRREVTRLVADARRELTEPSERLLAARVERAYREFLRVDEVAYRALRAGRSRQVRALFLGPEIRHFQAMASAAGELAAVQERSTARAQRRFDEERRDARRRLIVVGLGAGVLVVLLLITAQDVARLALERRGERPT